MRKLVWLIVITLLSGSCGVQAQRLRKANRPLLQVKKGYGTRGVAAALKWRVTIGMGGDTSPAMADLDGDGTLDIVAPVLDGPALFRLTQDGAVVWRTGLPARATAGVTLGDVDRDGALDILLCCDRVLLCFDERGKLKWQRAFPAVLRSMPTIADIDSDGKPEILLGCNDNSLHVLNSKGEERWSYATKSWITGGVAVADLDKDGKLEIAFGSLDGKVYCLNYSGALKWKFETGDWVQGSVVLADVDHDGGIDAVFSSDDGKLYCVSRLGTLKWVERFSALQRHRAHLVVADLDGEGTLETLLVTPDGNARLFTAFGDLIWTQNVGSNGPSSDEEVASIGSPLVVDLDGDKLPELVFASRDGTLRGLNVWGNSIFYTKVGGTIASSPILADADRDGKYEIYVGNIASARGDAGFFSQYEISAQGGRGWWTTVGGDPYRTQMASNASDYGRAVERGGDYATSWEPFGIGYRPQSGVLEPRRLRVTALSLQDSNGNRDGALDPGETALWRVQVENLGKGASYDSLLKVDLKDSFLKIDRTSAYLGWIAPGARKTATFRLSAPPIAELLDWDKEVSAKSNTPFRELPTAIIDDARQTAPKNSRATPVSKTSDTTATNAETEPAPVITKIKRRQPLGPQTARLQVFESGVQAAVSSARVFNMPPLPPQLRIVQRQIIDGKTAHSSGNGNGRLDAGENVVLRLLLRNDNLTTAQTATATLSANSRDVLVATPLATLRDVVPYGGRHIDFSLRVARQVTGKSVTLTLKTQPTAVHSAPIPARTETFVLPLGGGSDVDLDPPKIIFISPQALIAATVKDRIVITGVARDASGVTSLSFEGKSVPSAQWKKPGEARFWFSRPLKIGENVFPLTATDARGNSAAAWVRVIRKPGGAANAPAKAAAKPAVKTRKPSRRRRSR